MALSNYRNPLWRGDQFFFTGSPPLLDPDADRALAFMPGDLPSDTQDALTRKAGSFR